MPDPAASSIAEQITDLKAKIATRAPAPTLARFDREREGLDAAGIPAGVIAPGEPMPDGELLDVNGEPTSLAAARAGRPAVVITYRGAWCPYCNVALRAYQAQLQPALDEQGVKLIALSPQKPDGSLTIQEKHDLSFEVLSDPGNQVARALGIVTEPSQGGLESKAELGIDLEAANADGTNELPMPTALVVDREGTIRWIDVHPNYTTRSEPGEILAAVAAL